MLGTALSNPFEALAELNILAIVTNALLAGFALILVVPKDSPLITGVHHVNVIISILDGRQIGVARRKLDEWIEWACSSGLPASTRAAGTIENYREGILAYVRTRLNNGRARGLGRQNQSHHAPRLPLSFGIQPHLHALPNTAEASRLIPSISLRIGPTKSSGGADLLGPHHSGVISCS